MQVDRVIRALREKSGLSQRDLSSELGRSRTWAQTVETAGRSPALATVATVADVAGVDVCLVDRATGETIATIDPPAHQEPSH